MDRHEDITSAPGNPPKFLEPAKLEILRQVCEDGDEVDEIEALVGIRQWRESVVDGKACELDGALAPGDRLAIDIRAMQLALFGPRSEPQKRTSTAATEIQDSLEGSDISVHLLQRPSNIVDALLSCLE